MMRLILDINCFETYDTLVMYDLLAEILLGPGYWTFLSAWS